MRVRKRDGRIEAVDVNRITSAVGREADGLEFVDPLRVAIRTIGGLRDLATTRELDELSIQSAAALAGEEPEYAQFAARLLSALIHEEVAAQGIHLFVDSIEAGVKLGLINDRLATFVRANAVALEQILRPERNRLFEYFGLKTVYDRYLLRHPVSRDVLETPEQFFLRIACSLADGLEEATTLYELMSKLEYLPSSPTLFNSGTSREQLSSCFLHDSPQDHLVSIYDTYRDVAQLSKFSGGIGLAFHRVRSRGSLIESTNGHSSGIVPWLRTLDASVAAVNQGGKRKGACAVYLETWHADIEEFLELRDNTGDEASRTHNLNLANWVSDLFMRRVESDGAWSLFDPKRVPHLPDLFGTEFEKAYTTAEEEGLFTKQVKARELYGRMMKTLAQTGNGWITFKDRCNLTCNQTAEPGQTVHLSNLCTEIVEVSSENETAVCNLGSINLAKFVIEGGVDFDRLRLAVAAAVVALDRVIDLNYYPIDKARDSNQLWRPVGLGVMGLQDVFFQLGLAFDDDAARLLNRKIFEELYFSALTTSVQLARTKGAHPAFARTRAARGELQFDAWGVAPEDKGRWDALRKDIVATGLRNSLLLAVAPTATIASIAGCFECIEPQVSNLFKRETLSGDFLQTNRYLVRELRQRGLWNSTMRDTIKRGSGSVQGIEELPQAMRRIYRTAWEVPMRSIIEMAADRGAFIDQSQSLNLFMETPNIGALSSMYFYAWKKGLKTTYYLRSRPATRIAQTTVSAPEAPSQAAAAVSCSLENPESCEACQ
jgi:ribonucleoside-diphosphate reductase alpha chain